MEIHSNNNNGNIETTFLPTAEITVLNPSSNTLKNVPILLDTGAEVSFIDSKLAETLNLPRVQETKLRLQTFGSEEVKESASHKVELEAWDSNGDPLHFDLFTHNILTKSLTTPTISTEDIDFIHQNSIPFKLPKNNKIITPLILIGCDQIWSLLKHNKAQIKLPSGLHLTPTRMGHVISGKTKIAKRMYPHNEESNKWDRYWTLESRVNTITVMEDEDSKNWDNYWTLDSAGTEEYSNSEKEIKAIVDKQVWKQFNETIQKREDGYYVRLPWKQLSSPLLDNRAIALHRLASTWRTLKKNKELLDMYNNVFLEQIHSKILEEVPKAAVTNYSKVHYISHQAVLTPQETTTKLRIPIYPSLLNPNPLDLVNEIYYGEPTAKSSLMFCSQAIMGKRSAIQKSKKGDLIRTPGPLEQQIEGGEIIHRTSREKRKRKRVQQLEEPTFTIQTFPRRNQNSESVAHIAYLACSNFKWKYIPSTLSEKIISEARKQLHEIDQEECPQEVNAKKSLRQVSLIADSDEDSEAEELLNNDYDDQIIDLDPAVEAELSRFMCNKYESDKTLYNIIEAKINAKMVDVDHALSSSDPNEFNVRELDPEVVEMYKEVGRVLSKYRSGKVPKAFKVIPKMVNWEQILYLTDPIGWSAAAIYQATRLFASNLNPRMCQRFYNLVLLPRLRDDIDEYKKLNFHLYQALCKAMYKPAAFFKGIILPLCEIAEMEYNGANSIFLRALIDKKFALPYKAIDAIVFHFLRHL
ncbi:Bystin [Dictyocaulus viviparus]|uniref:Bystin n=1 Tax=Dictyocaulus viviparus TaxID=29172 RepID=A0A0D8XVM7_DICVI|nr:Bystin [Dictyocaulus viviparus]